MKGWGSPSREGRLLERRVYMIPHPPVASVSHTGPRQKPQTLAKVKELDLTREMPAGNQPDKDQLLRMAGKPAAGKERGPGRRDEAC